MQGARRTVMLRQNAPQGIQCRVSNEVSADVQMKKLTDLPAEAVRPMEHAHRASICILSGS